MYMYLVQLRISNICQYQVGMGFQQEKDMCMIPLINQYDLSSGGPRWHDKEPSLYKSHKLLV